MKLNTTLLCFVWLFLFCQVFSKPSSKGKCGTCKSFIKSFEAGLKNTENSNFAGGDTSWEEENQPNYANSEVRLIEILESVCSGNDYDCSRFLDDNEEDIERWWLKLRHSGHPDLQQWLCFSHIKVCCPEGTYGPSCKDCPGGKESPCNGHGTCEGAEEIDGFGVCDCDDGYEGELCDTCEDGFYNESNTCHACEDSCKGSCSGPGPGNCYECAPGYIREDEEGDCEDVDECDDEVAECKDGTYCDNTPGSYKCKDCDKACKHLCTGKGPMACVECSNGYKNMSGYCIDINECTEDKDDCKDGTYCENTPGKYKCNECDISCELTCTGLGSSGCDACKTGFVKKDGSCEDVNECLVPVNPCNEVSESCFNTKGSFTCKCRSGYTRVEGKCTSWEEAEEKRSNQALKNKKKKKKSKSAGGSHHKEGKKKQPEAAVTSDQSINAEPSNTPTSKATEINNLDIQMTEQQDFNEWSLSEQPIPVSQSTHYSNLDTASITHTTPSQSASPSHEPKQEL